MPTYDYPPEHSASFDTQKNNPSMQLKPKTNPAMPLTASRLSTAMDGHLTGMSRPVSSGTAGYLQVKLKNTVIQKQGGSSDEEDMDMEEAEREDATYEEVLALYQEKTGDEPDTFDDYIGDWREPDFYRCIRYILEQNPQLLLDKQLYRTVGYIDNGNIDSVTLKHYTCALFQYRNTIVKKLSDSGDSYLDYVDFFTQDWFNDTVEERFFSANKADLDALNRGILPPLLISPDAVSFINHQAKLSPWFASCAIEDTVKLGFPNCLFLSTLFTPGDNNAMLPHYANRISPNHLQSFFTKCHALGLGVFAIDEITKNPDYMALVNNHPCILGIINKNNRFSDWINALVSLLNAQSVTLEVSKEMLLSSDSGLTTYEKTSTVIDAGTGKPVDTFVYHRHPNGLSVSVEHAHVTNKHLKPSRGSTTYKLDYGQIPQIIKDALGI